MLARRATSPATALMERKDEEEVPSDSDDGTAWRQTGVERGGDRPDTRFPAFDIDLSLPASERWKPVIGAYKGKVQAVMHEVETHVVGEWLAAQRGCLAWLAHRTLECAMLFLRPWFGFQDDIAALANGFGVPVYKMMVLQLAYELSAACTSFVVNSPQGPILGRNLDWPLPEIADLVVDLRFRRGTTTVFTATSLVGYVGCLTGCRPHGFAASINFRSCIEPWRGWTNVARGVLRTIAAACRGSWPSAFLLRRALETQSDYAGAVHMLSTQPLLAPTYFIIAGTRRNEGVCLARDRVPRRTHGARHIWLQHQTVVQSNMDHWDRRPEQDEAQGESLLRREVAWQLLDGIPQEHVTFDTLWRVLSTYPVGNEMSVHYSLMCPAQGRMTSGPNFWFDPTFDIPTGCTSLTLSTRRGTDAHLRRRCSRRVAKAQPAPFAQYCCSRHDPLDRQWLLSDGRDAPPEHVDPSAAAKAAALGIANTTTRAARVAPATPSSLRRSRRRRATSTKTQLR